jgi:hypothetical protein
MHKMQKSINSLPACTIGNIRQLRAEGLGWGTIAKRLGIGLTRLKRIMKFIGEYSPEPSPQKKPIPARKEIDLDIPIPPGHPLTWSLISNEPYPGRD